MKRRRYRSVLYISMQSGAEGEVKVKTVILRMAQGNLPRLLLGTAPTRCLLQFCADACQRDLFPCDEREVVTITSSKVQRGGSGSNEVSRTTAPIRKLKLAPGARVSTGGVARLQPWFSHARRRPSRTRGDPGTASPGGRGCRTPHRPDLPPRARHAAGRARFHALPPRTGTGFE